MIVERSASWAVTVEGRDDPTAVLLLTDDRVEAESIAAEMRVHGHPVVVCWYVPGPPSLIRR
jgi:hypothetical protein